MESRGVLCGEGLGLKGREGMQGLVRSMRSRKSKTYKAEKLQSRPEVDMPTNGGVLLPIAKGVCLAAQSQWEGDRAAVWVFGVDTARIAHGQDAAESRRTYWIRRALFDRIY